MKNFLMALLFVIFFGMAQGIIYLKDGTTPSIEARRYLSHIKSSKGFVKFIYEKQLWLKRNGAGVLLKDHMTVSQWYMYKGLMAFTFGSLGLFVSGVIFKSEQSNLIALGLAIIGFWFLDLFLRIENKASNEEMMPDICEMSRSVLYGKRGGQYIADALRDSVIVVENKRLKTALMRLRNDLDSGISLNDCLDEFELSFSNGEISSFCTVIKSLQTTGQVDESLRTLENNIEREQISINKRRCMILEQKTMMYVILIAMDLMAMILYSIIMKLLELQIGF